MVTTIQKWGNSQGVRIPKEILKSANIKENERFLIVVKDEKIILEKEKKKKNIKDLFKNYKGDYVPKEFDFGEKEGKEVW